MSVVKTAVVETQVAIPTITPSSQPPTPISPTPIPPTQTPYFPVPFDNHDPEAVLRAYFDAWNRNDFVTTASIDGGFGGEPVEYIHILKISLISPPSSTECTFNVLFEIKVKGQGVSMHSGNYGWTYTLTWNANRGIWLITNHGAG